ncbi:Arc family DNA-binding protein [Pseudomonas peli]|uniref:Arc family DNA-binding protein n=1 Tax=Pseudomonas peli TaxID=592361 RepID=UPI00285C8915|nr:Arc family DNA-binding protein [Pseudomonas peli]MDR7024807.1 molybdopterin converting factor small subunit [Pseudomonas peli]
MSRIDPQVNFRMPAELKKKLEEAAAQNKRSTTAEIVARLEASFPADSVEYEAFTSEMRPEVKELYSKEDIQAALDQFLASLTFERRGHKPSPTSKKPLRKGSRPLGVDPE